GGVRGAAVADGGAVAVAGAFEVAADLLLLLLAAAGGAQLEPLRHQAVVATARGPVDALVDHLPPGRVGEAVFALARAGRVRLLAARAATAELGRGGFALGARAIAGGRALAERRTVGIVPAGGVERRGAHQHDHGVEPEGFAAGGGLFQKIALAR